MSRKSIQLLVNFVLFLLLVIRLSMHSSIGGESISFIEIYIIPAIVVTSGFVACLIRKWYVVFIPYVAYGLVFINLGVSISYVAIGLIIALIDILLNIRIINGNKLLHVN